MFVTKAAKLWRDRLERFEQVDITVRQFCVNEGVSQASFYHWRAKLRRSNQAGDQRGLKPLATFVPVRLPAEPPATPTSMMTVDLPGGIRIRFEVPANAETTDVKAFDQEASRS